MPTRIENKVNDMLWRLEILMACTIVGTACCWSQEATVKSGTSGIEESVRSEAIKKWETEIVSLEKLDATQSHRSGEILLIGSSSIRLWKNIDVDMAPYPVIRRGYGGAKYSDLAVFCERLVHPHHYRALVVFVANDISGDPDDHTPEQVERWIRHIIDVSQRHQPEAPVLLIEVTPTNKRLEHWPRIRELNARIREIALSTPMVFFVNTAEHFLDPAGKPRAEYFVEDKLHLNDAGYGVWSDLIRRHLDEVFRLLSRYKPTGINSAEVGP